MGVIMGSIDSFKNWLAAPFSSSMNAGQWFLFFGLLIVISMLWHMILRLVTD
jgi:hypothetical protein